MSHEQANFQNSLFCSCLLSGRITTAINTANDYTDDVLQNGFGTNPVWLIREKVMSASRNNHHQRALHAHHFALYQIHVCETSVHHEELIVTRPVSHL